MRYLRNPSSVCVEGVVRKVPPEVAGMGRGQQMDPDGGNR